MQYFSEKEKGKKPQTVNEISIPVWNGIVGIFEQYANNGSFAQDFPEQCPDGRGVYGADRDMLFDRAKAEIPELELPVNRKAEYIVVPSKDYWEEDKKVPNSIDTYSALDFIQFCYQHLHDSYHAGEFHEYYGHFHLAFRNTTVAKRDFRESMNSLFERNGVAYSLEEGGSITRIVPEEYGGILVQKNRTKDEKLNQLLTESKSNFMKPNIKDRRIGMQLLWDAFERAKTFYAGDKKASITELIGRVSNGNALFEQFVTAEAKTLTDIGNQFQIRHFEKDKVEVVDLAHIDYFYFRMLSMVNLFITELEK